MTVPDADHLFRVLDATWPAARTFDTGPWRIREGQGGGQRVSAATANSPVLETDIAAAETEMQTLDQRPLFMVRPGDTDLDDWLGARGYDIVDPVFAYLAPIDSLTADLPVRHLIPTWPPLSIQREIWQAGHIGPARIAVMERAAEPRTTLLARHRDTPAGTAFVAVAEGVAMLHALEVRPDHRRGGVGRMMMHGAANWARLNGAVWLALMVTQANAAANALYRKLGMDVVSGYHYRRAGVAE